VTTTYAYDALNRLISKVYSDSTPTATLVFDVTTANGISNLTNTIGRLVEATNSNATTVNAYNSVGDISTQYQWTPLHNSSPVTFSYAYDFLHNISSISNNLGYSLNQTWSGAGRISTVGGMTLSYSPAGDVATKTYGGQVEERTYNDRLQMRTQTVYSAPAHTPIFDGEYTYNEGSADNGNVATAAEGPAVNISSNYISQCGFTNYNFGQMVDYNYTDLGWTSVGASNTSCNNGPAYIAFRMPGVPPVVTAVRLYVPSQGSGTMDTYQIGFSSDGVHWTTVSQITPNQAGWNTVTWTSVGQQGYWGLILNEPFPYGTVISEVQWLAQSTASYSYDAENRLASLIGSPCSAGWGYDRYGNRLSQNGSSGCPFGWSVSYNTKNQITNSGFQYDAAGNMTNGSSPAQSTLSYDAEGRLVSITGNTAATYKYGGSGMRVEKSANGGAPTDFLRDLAGNVLQEYTSSGVTAGRSFFLGRPFIEALSSGSYYDVVDRLGTTRAVFSTSQGQVVESLVSAAYGEQEQQSGQNLPVYKFTGYQRDSETNNDYAFARYYSSSMGQFLTPDPAGQSATCPFNPQTQNRYAYVTDNPVNRTDPTGLCGDGDNSDCGGIGITLPIFPGGGGGEGPAPPSPHPVFVPLNPLALLESGLRDCNQEYADCLAKVDQLISPLEKAHNKEYKECLQDCVASAPLGAVGAAICAGYCSLKSGLERVGDEAARNTGGTVCGLRRNACERQNSQSQSGGHSFGLE
jgi:RHS repeat-associated protein